MPPQLHRLIGTSSLALRPKPCISRLENLPVRLQQLPRRCITANEKPLPEAEKKDVGPNQEQLPHVSEEAAALGKITGEGGPEIEQGTPVQEVLKRDEKAQEKAPQVLQDEVKKSSPSGSRSFSTTTRTNSPELVVPRPLSNSWTVEEQHFDALNDQPDLFNNEGHLYGLPELPMARNMHLKKRDDPLVDQITKLIMKSGKLSKAQSTVAMILQRLRTAKPPTSDPRRPLIPGSPPASHLPLNPVLYMTLAIDSVAPLLRMRSQRGMAGGGVALQIPIPLNMRQRRRTAIMWILDAASKKRSMGSGRAMFAHKVADELIAIVEGRSGVWDKRGAIHKLSVAARANLATRLRR